jgi:hypothetical protein
MEEHRKQGIFYYCDEKYSPRHKCREKKYFQIDASTPSSYANIPSNETPDTEDAQPSVHAEDFVAVHVEPEELVILLHSILAISSPQTLKINGYIKHKSFVVLIDSGSSRDFIHRMLAEEIHCFVRPISDFQILIINGGTMKCCGHCENAKLQMGYYHLKIHMFSIAMGGCDIVLGVKWLRTLRQITMGYQELYMRFTQEAHTYTFQGLQASSPKIIISHRMEKMLKKFHRGVNAQFHAIQITNQASSIVPPILQLILDKYPKLF